MYIKKLWPFLFCISLSAEILIVQKVNNIFEPFPGKKANKAELDTIADILFKYQWPMCTMNTELTTEEKDELFQQSPNAEAKFITKKLHAINPNYYAFWVPTTFYELVCLHTLFQQVPSFSNTIHGTPFLDAVSGIPNFLPINNSNIIDTEWKRLLTKTNAGDKNWETKKESFTVYQKINNYFYKQHRAYFEINERVATILFDHNKNLIKNMNSEDIYKTIKSIFNDPQEVFIKQIQDNYVNKWWPSNTNPNSYPLTSRVHFNAINTNYIKQAIDIEYYANNQNNGLLFRGTRPFFDKATKKPLVISPIHKDAYTKKITPADPYSISFGNSLFAGCIADATATAYQYLSQTPTTASIAGYGLYIDKAQYIENQNNNIFLISPLAYIASLFTYGEMFHSRSKAALNPKKPTRIIGLAYKVTIIDPDSLLLITKDPRRHASTIIDYFIKNANIIYQKYQDNHDGPDKQKEQIENEILENADAASIYATNFIKISKFMHKVVTPKLTQKKLVILAESLEALAKSTTTADISAPHSLYLPIKTGIIAVDNTNLAHYIESMSDEQLLAAIKEALEIEKIKEGPIVELIEGLKDARKRGTKTVRIAITFQFAEGDWQLYDQLNRIIKIMNSKNLKYSTLYDKLSEFSWDLADGVGPMQKK